MKAVLIKGVVSLALLTSVAVAPAGAALIDRGAFGDGEGGFMNLIYDDHLNITWLGDANFAKTSGYDANGKMKWEQAKDWASGLTVGGYTDWRLPTALNVDGSGPCLQLNCTGSEMGHLFYVEGITAADPGVFDVQVNRYWSSTPKNSRRAWFFTFVEGGGQYHRFKTFPYFGWAVRSGDVSAPPAVPEPSTMLLLGSGLVGLIGWRRVRRG